MTGGPLAPPWRIPRVFRAWKIPRHVLERTLTLRVSEARVEYVGHAIARLAPRLFLRIGAKPGDVFENQTGGTVAVGPPAISDMRQKACQIDGTPHSIAARIVRGKSALRLRYSSTVAVRCHAHVGGSCAGDDCARQDACGSW